MSNIEEFSREDFDLMYDMYEELTGLLSQLNKDVPQIKVMYDGLRKSIEQHNRNLDQAISVITSETQENIKKQSDSILLDISKQINAAEAISMKCSESLLKIQNLSTQILTAAEFQTRIEKRLSAMEEKLRLLEGDSKFPSNNLPSNSVVAPSAEGVSISEYFKRNGFEVADKRDSGGALWVIGSETSLKPYVEQVRKIYGVAGKYHTGIKSTGHRPAWYTDSKK